MKRSAPLIFFLGGFFLFLDQFLKWQAGHAWDAPLLLNQFFGWFPFLNSGVAFSLPVPGLITISVTIPILFIFSYLLGKELARPASDGHLKRLIALVFILTGAISNLADRVIYHQTIDYLRIFTGIINLADVLIVLGFVLYFLELNEHGR